jgi:hypothetical protein
MAIGEDCGKWVPSALTRCLLFWFVVGARGHRKNSFPAQCMRLGMQGSFAFLRMTELIFWACFL